MESERLTCLTVLHPTLSRFGCISNLWKAASPCSGRGLRFIRCFARHPNVYILLSIPNGQQAFLSNAVKRMYTFVALPAWIEFAACAQLVSIYL